MGQFSDAKLGSTGSQNLYYGYGRGHRGQGRKAWDTWIYQFTIIFFYPKGESVSHPYIASVSPKACKSS